MAEKKKKRGIVKRIFKWIWLVILTLLIFGALIYDAPGKVIALLLIILAGCTILPKGAGKWFWLSVAAVVVILTIWVFLPDDSEDWRPFTFDEELAALKARYAVPDSENAALLYSKLFETLDIDSNPPEFFNRAKTPSTDGPWRSADHPETAEWLKDQQKTIDTLVEIARIGKCQFPIKGSPMSRDKEFDHLSKIRRCAFLLISSANNDIAEGRADEACQKYLAVLQMAKHLCQHPALIDLLVGVAVESLALKHLNQFIIEGEPTNQQLESIVNLPPDLKDNWCDDFGRRLEYEKLFDKNSFCCLFYQINPQGRVRLRQGPIAVMRDWYPDKPLPRLPYWQRKLTKASTILGWFFFPSTPQKVSKVIDAKFEEYYAMTKPGFDWRKKLPEVRPHFKLNYTSTVEQLTDISGQTYSRIHEIYLRTLTYRRGSRLLSAIKQYKNENGNWPEDLNAIKSLAPAEAFIDPVYRSQFEYETYGKNFSLYGGQVNIWPK